MFSFNLGRWLKTWFRRRVRPIERKPRFRLQLEQLEDRITPVVYTWAGGALSTWSGPSWTSVAGASIIPSQQIDLIFNTAGPAGTNDLANLSIKSITFTANDVTLAGNPFTLGNSAALGGGNGTIFVGAGLNNENINAGMNITLGSGAAGNAQFISILNGSQLNIKSNLIGLGPNTGSQVTKDGPGTLILSGASTFTGTFTIDNDSGIVQAASSQAFGNAATTVEVGSNSQLQLTGGITVANTVHLFGNGPANTGALFNLAGANIWSGGVILDGGGGFVNVSAGSLTVSGVISDAGGAVSLTKLGTGTLILSNANTYQGSTYIANGILTVRNPLALGAVPSAGTFTQRNDITGDQGSLRLDFVAPVFPTIPANSQYYILRDPSLAYSAANPYVGFVVPNYTLYLLSRGFNNQFTLENAAGANAWSGPVVLQTDPPNSVNQVNINVAHSGAVQSHLLISGIISDQDSGNPALLSKVAIGRGNLVLEPTIHTASVDLGNTYKLVTLPGGFESLVQFGGSGTANTHLGATNISSNSGTVTLVDSLGLGAAAKTAQHIVGSGSSLNLVSNVGHIDSVTGTTNRLSVNAALRLDGTGYVFNGKDTGTIHSISGINTYAPNQAYQAASGNQYTINVAANASIGVEREPVETANANYFTNDYSLTVTAKLNSGAGTTLTKVDPGHLIMPAANDGLFQGIVIIRSGWITMQDPKAFGAQRLGQAQELWPTHIVESGAALMFKPLVSGTSFDFYFNLRVQGMGINHPFSLIHQKGAVENLAGVNTISGNISFIGQTGIGVEQIDPAITSELSLNGEQTQTAPPASFVLPTVAAVDGATQYTQIIDTGSTSGTISIAYTGMSANNLKVYYGPRGTPGSTLLANTPLTGAGTFPGAALPYSGGGTNLEIVIDDGLTGGSATWTYTVTINPSLLIANVKGGIVKVGSRRLILQGSGIYTGGVDIQQGVLRVLNNAALGPPAGNFGVAVQNGAALELTSLATSANGGLAAGANIWGVPLTLNGTGNTTFGLAPLTVLSSDNLWQAPITLNSNVAITFQGALANQPVATMTAIFRDALGNLTLTGTSPTIDVATTTTGVSGAIPVSAVQTLTFGGAITDIAPFTAFFKLKFGAATTGNILWSSDPNVLVTNIKNALDTIGALNGNVSISLTSPSINVAPNARFVSTGVVSDSGTAGTALAPSDFIVSGGGEVLLAGANTYRGTTFVNQSTLTIQDDPSHLGQALGATSYVFLDTQATPVAHAVQELAMTNFIAGVTNFRLYFDPANNPAVPGTNQTAAITYMGTSADAVNIQTALQGLTTIGATNVRVTQQNPGVFLITFYNTLSSTTTLIKASLAGNGIVAGTTIINGVDGGTVVANNAQLQMEGSITVGGEPLIIQGAGNNLQSTVQNFTVSTVSGPPNPQTGTYQLSLNDGVTTALSAAIPYNADASQVQAALQTMLNGIPAYAGGQVTVAQTATSAGNNSTQRFQFNAVGAGNTYQLYFDPANLAAVLGYNLTAPITFSGNPITDRTRIQAALSALTTVSSPAVGGAIIAGVVTTFPETVSIVFTGGLGNQVLPDVKVQVPPAAGSITVSQTTAGSTASRTFTATFSGALAGQAVPLMVSSSPIQAAPAGNAAASTLIVGTTYYYLITAVTPAGEFVSNERTFVPTGPVPGPALPSAQLSWNTVPGATSYNVYRTTNQGNYSNARIATGLAGTTLLDSGSATTAFTPPGNTTVGTPGFTTQGGTANATPFQFFNIGPSPITNAQVVNGAFPSGLPAQITTGRVTGVETFTGAPQDIVISTAGGGFWLSKDNGVHWNQLFDSTGGTPALFGGAVAVDQNNPDIMYFGTGEGNNSADSYYGTGVWQFNSTTFSFTQLGGAANPLVGKVINKIIVDPNNIFQIWVAVSDTGTNGTNGASGVYRWNGSTWTNLSSGASWTLSTDVSDIALQGGTLFAASVDQGGPGGQGGVMSTNSPGGAATWTDTAMNAAITTAAPTSAFRIGTIKLAPSGGGVVAAVTNSLGGANSLLGVMTLTGAVWAVAYAPASMGFAGPVAIANYLGNQGHYASAILATSQAGVGRVVVGGTDAGGGTTNVLLLNNVAGIWQPPIDISRDATQIGPHTDVHAITLDSSNNILVGTDGGVWRGTMNWGGNSVAYANLNGDLSITQLNSVDPKPETTGTIIAAAQDNGTSRYSAGSQQWAQAYPFDGELVRFVPGNPTQAYKITSTVGNRSAFISVNSGSTWNTILAGARTLAVDANNPSRVVFGGGSLQESLTNGTGLVNVGQNLGVPGFSFDMIELATKQGNYQADPAFPINPITSPNFSAHAANFPDTLTIYVADRDNAGGHSTPELYVTKDAGVRWSGNRAPVTLMASGTFISDLFVDPANRDTIYVTTSDFVGSVGSPTNNSKHVFKSTDAGRNWTDISSGLPDLPTWSITGDPRSNDLYVGTDKGVYKLTGGTGTWQKFGAGLPNVQVRDVQIDTNNNILTVGTYGRGVWQFYLANTQQSAGAVRALGGTDIWNGPITLAGPTTISAAGSQNLQSDIAGAQLTLRGNITDLTTTTANTLTKIGGGDVVLQGTNTYAGVTLVQAGNLVVQNSSALGSTGTAGTQVLFLTSPVAGVTKYDFTFQAVTNAPAFTVTYTGVAATDAAAIQAALMSLSTVTAGGGAVSVTPDATGKVFTITFTAGPLTTSTFIGPSALVTASVAAGLPGAAYTLTAGATHVTAGAALEVDSSLNAEPITLNGNGVQPPYNGHNRGALVNGKNVNTYTGTITLNTHATIGVTSGQLTIASVNPNGIMDGGAGYTLTKEGDGTLVLASANAYQGGTVVNKGVLNVANSGALGTGPSTIVSDGAQLQLQQSAANQPALNVPTLAAGGVIPAGTTYYYVVTAIVGGVESIISNERSVTTASANQRVNLSWNPVAGATGYKIYRSSTSTLYGNTLLATLGAVTSFSDIGLAGGAGTPTGINVTGQTLYLSGTGISNNGALRNVAGNNTWAGNIVLSDVPRFSTSSSPGGVVPIFVNPGNALTLSGNISEGSPSIAPVQAAPSAGAGTLTGTFFYVVTAVTQWGESVASNEQSFTAAAQGIQLSWSAVPGATSYRVYRTIVSGSYVDSLLTSVAAPALTFLDAGSIIQGGPPQIGQNYIGSTYFSQSFSIPPDTDGAVGINHFVEMINGTFRVYNKVGGAAVVTKSLDQFWTDSGLGAAAVNNTFDPRVVFDHVSQRWFAASASNRRTASSNYLLAVSTSSNPTLPWVGFSIDGDAANLTWMDFPTLGLDADGVYLSGSMFTIAADVFDHVSIISIPKADLLLGAPTIANRTEFANEPSATRGFTVQPAVDYGASDGRAAMLSAAGIRRTDVLNAGTTTATLSASSTITVPAFALGPNGAQPGAKVDLNTGDTRFSGTVAEVGDSLWAVHTVAVAGRAGLRWYEIHEPTSAVLQSGTISDVNADYYYPSIAANAFGEVVIGFSASSNTGPTGFVSSYAATGTTVGGITTFAVPMLLRQGVSDYEILDPGGRNRWGDYSSTTVDPTDPHRIWTIQEFVSSTDRWSTQITEIIFGGQSATPPVAPVSGIAEIGAGTLVLAGNNSYTGGTYVGYTFGVANTNGATAPTVPGGVIAVQSSTALGANQGNAIQRIATYDTPGALPAGTFALTFNGQTTGVLPFSASAQQVQTALNALTNIGAGGVSVTRSTIQTGLNEVQTIAMGNISYSPVLNAIPAATAGGSLTATTTFYYVVTAVVGGVESFASSEQAQATTATNNTLNLTWNPVAGAGSYRVYRSTVPGNYTNKRLAIVTAPTTNYTDDGTVALTANTPPTFTLTFGGATTGPIGYTGITGTGAGSTAAAIQAALQALASIGTNNVTVTSDASGAVFTITFGGAMADRPEPLVVANVSTSSAVVTQQTPGVGGISYIYNVVFSGPALAGAPQSLITVAASSSASVGVSEVATGGIGTLVYTGAALLLDGDPNHTGASIDIPYNVPAGNTIALSGAGTASSGGALVNISGNNRVQSNVLLQSSSTIGASAAAQLTVTGTLQDVTATTAIPTTAPANLTKAGKGSVVLAPVAQIITINDRPVQNGPTVTAGGSLAAGVPLYFVITAQSASGESMPSNEQVATPTGSNATINLSWNAVLGATGYKIYRSGTPGLYGATSLLASVAAATLTFSDNGSVTPLLAGTPPASRTFTLTYSNGTPAGTGTTGNISYTGTLGATGTDTNIRTALTTLLGTLGISGSVTVLARSPESFTVRFAGNAAVDLLALTGVFTNTDTGTVSVAPGNSYTGSTFVNGGILNIQNANSLGYNTSSVQQVAVSGSSGSFQLTVAGAPAQNTVPLQYGATAAQVQTALNALSNINTGGGFVTVTQQGNNYLVYFNGGPLANKAQSPLSFVSPLSGGITSITITELVAGGASTTTVANGATLQLQSNPNTLATAFAEASRKSLTINGSGVNGMGALQNVAGNNSWSLNSALNLGSNAAIGADGITRTATTVNTSTNVTLASTAGLAVNMTVTGAGIAPQTTITAVGAGFITLSLPATASGTAPLTFGSLFTINQQITGGAFGVQKVGLGTVRYTSATGNTYTGLTDVNAGMLQLFDAGTGFAVNGNLQVGDNTNVNQVQTLTFTGFGNLDTYTLGYGAATTASIAYYGNAAYEAIAIQAALNAALGANFVSVAPGVSAGVFLVTFTGLGATNPATLLTGNVLTGAGNFTATPPFISTPGSLPSANYAIAQLLAAQQINNTGSATVNADGLFDLNNYNQTLAGLTINTGTTTLGTRTTGGTLTVNGTLSETAGGTLTLPSASQIANVVGTLNTNASNVLLGGASTQLNVTGAAVLTNNSTMTASGASSQVNITGSMTVTNSTVNLSGVSSMLSVSTTLTETDSVLNASGLNSQYVVNGLFTMTGGNVNLTGVGSKMTLKGNLNATSDAAGSAKIAGLGELVLDSVTPTLTINVGTQTTDLLVTAPINAGPADVSGGITKAGAGRLELAAANLYPGTTTVNAGDVQVDVLFTLAFAGYSAGDTFRLNYNNGSGLANGTGQTADITYTGSAATAGTDTEDNILTALGTLLLTAFGLPASTISVIPVAGNPNLFSIAFTGLAGVSIGQNLTVSNVVSAGSANPAQANAIRNVVLNGAASGTPVASLSGTGFATNVTMGAGSATGTVNPGGNGLATKTGVLSASNVTWTSSATFTVDITNASNTHPTPNRGTDYDRLHVGGDADLGNALLTGLPSGANINVNDVYTIMTVTGTLTGFLDQSIYGTRQQVNNGDSVFLNGQKFTLNYFKGTGNDRVVLTRQLAQINSFTLASSLNPSVYGQDVAFTALVTPEFGSSFTTANPVVTFDVDAGTILAPVNINPAVQQVVFTNFVNTNTFTLTYFNGTLAGTTTPDIVYTGMTGTDGPLIQSRLNAVLTGLGFASGLVAVTPVDANHYTITFSGAAATNIFPLRANVVSSPGGGTVATAGIATYTPQSTIPAIWSPAINEIQNVTTTGAGAFSLTFGANIGNFNTSDSAATVQAGLQALASFGGPAASNVQVSKAGNVFTVTFVGTLANFNQAALTPGGVAGVATVQDGSALGAVPHIIAATFSDTNGVFQAPVSPPSITQVVNQNTVNIALTTTASITAASWAAGTASITAANTFAPGQTVLIAGMTPAGYNNGGVPVTIVTASATGFTYALAANPGGPGTVFGTATATGSPVYGQGVLVNALVSAVTPPSASLTALNAVQNPQGSLMYSVDGGAFVFTPVALTPPNPATFSPRRAAQLIAGTLLLAPGAHTVAVTYNSADPNYSASIVPFVFNFNVVADATTLAITPVPASSFLGQDATFNIQVNPALAGSTGDPQGTVKIYDGDPGAGGILLNASTATTASFAIPSVGNSTTIAVTTTTATGIAIGQFVHITDGTRTIIALVTNVVSNNVTIQTALIVAGAGTMASGATVTLAIDPTAGTASFTLKNLPLGTHNIFAVFATANANYTGITNSFSNFVVQKGTTATAIQTPLPAASYGTAASFNVQVSEAPSIVAVFPAIAPTGNVVLYAKTGLLTATAAAFVIPAVGVAVGPVNVGTTAGMTGGQLVYITDGTRTVVATVAINSGTTATFTPVFIIGGVAGSTMATSASITGLINLGTGSLNAGGLANIVTQATGVNALPVGNIALVAVYGGDPNFASSQDASKTITVTGAPANVTVTSASPNPGDYTLPITLNASVVSAVPGLPTGAGSFVTFWDVAAFNALTTTSASFVIPGVGSSIAVSVNATTGMALGQFLYIASGANAMVGLIVAPGVVASTVNVQTVAIFAGAAGNTMANGANVSLAVKLNAAPANLVGPGNTASFIVPAGGMLAGAHTIYGSYTDSATGNYINGIDTPLTNYKVNNAPTSLSAIAATWSTGTFSPLTGTPAVFNQPVTFTTIVTSPGGPVTMGAGSKVTFVDLTTGLTLGSGNVGAGGVASLTTTAAAPLIVATHNIQGTYTDTADLYFATSNRNLNSFSVTAAPTLINPLTSSAPGSTAQLSTTVPVVYTATIQTQSPATVANVVSNATAPIWSAGTATFWDVAPTTLTSTTAPFVIPALNSTVVVSVTATAGMVTNQFLYFDGGANIFVGQITAVGATVTVRNVAVLAGTAGATINPAANNVSRVTMVTGAVVNVVNGQATASATYSAATDLGTHKIWTTYNPPTTGTINYLAATPVMINQTVLKGAAITANPTPASPLFGQAVNLAVQLTAVAPSTGIPSGGTVTVTDDAAHGNAVLGTFVNLPGTGIVPGGIALVGPLTPGTHVLTVSYAGDTTGPVQFADVIKQVTINVAAASTNMAIVSSSPVISEVGQLVTFTATLMVTNAPLGTPGYPTGVVNFSNGGTLLQAVNLNGAGNPANVTVTNGAPYVVTITYSTSTLAFNNFPGYTISASYAGSNPNFAASNTPSVLQYVIAQGSLGNLATTQWTQGQPYSAPIVFTRNAINQNAVSVSTAVPPAATTSTSTFVIPAVGNTTTVNVASTAGMVIGQILGFVNGANQINAEITGIAGSTLTIKTTVVISNAIGSIVTGASVYIAPSNVVAPGLTIAIATGNVLIISGTPTTPGVYPFTVYLTDAAGVTITKNYSITINAPATLSALSNTTGTFLSPFTSTLTIAGGTPFSPTLPVLFQSITGLPPGLTAAIAGNTITIYGTPGLPGTYSSVNVAVRDAAGVVSNQTYTITIQPGSTVTTLAVYTAGALSSVASALVGQTVYFVAAVAGPVAGPTGSIFGTVTFTDSDTTQGTGGVLGQGTYVGGSANGNTAYFQLLYTYPTANPNSRGAHTVTAKFNSAPYLGTTYFASSAPSAGYALNVVNTSLNLVSYFTASSVAGVVQGGAITLAALMYTVNPTPIPNNVYDVNFYDGGVGGTFLGSAKVINGVALFTISPAQTAAMAGSTNGTLHTITAQFVGDALYDTTLGTMTLYIIIPPPPTR